MQKHYTIYFWSQDPQINDCIGNRSTWNGKATSLCKALEKASKNHLHFRLSHIQITEMEKGFSGPVVVASYIVNNDAICATFKHQYSPNGNWCWGRTGSSNR